VRELVDEDDLRPPREDRVEVHLLERLAAVLDPSSRNDLEALEERRGLGAPVRLDDADDDVEALATPLLAPPGASRTSCRRRARRRRRP
jgi:hypothetical protein